MSNVTESGLTKEEDAVLDSIVASWDGFIHLPVMHPSDQEEFGTAIHLLQKLIALRVCRRDYPNTWPTYSASNKK
jgi:hypothetical protein